MPIFAYRCDRCGFEQDVLQKRSDPVLTQCPSCGEAAFARTLTAPAFQLKGSGWYVTDFRDKGGKSGGAPATEPASGETSTKTDAPKTDASKTDASASAPAKSESKPAASGASTA